MESARGFTRAQTDHVICLTTDITPRSLVRLTQNLAAAVTSKTRVVIDLTDIPRLESALLYAIVAADKAARAAEHLLVLTGVRGETAQLLAETGLDQRLQIVEREELDRAS